MKILEIFDYLKELAPLELQEGWDNAGFLFGSREEELKGALLALDATTDVIEEAHEKDCNLIITHHPLIFGSISDVLQEDVIGRKLIRLGKYGINVISMHTNLDKILVNEILIKKLGAFTYEPALDYMRVGFLEEPSNISDYLEFLKESLNNSGLRYYSSGKPVYKIACIGGAGAEGIIDAYKCGCDTFITADVKHHEWLTAKELGINLIDADHFNTENPVIPELYELLSKKFSSEKIMLSVKNTQVVCYA